MASVMRMLASTEKQGMKNQGKQGEWMRSPPTLLQKAPVTPGVVLWPTSTAEIPRDSTVSGVKKALLVGLLGVAHRWGRVLGPQRLIAEMEQM